MKFNNVVKSSIKSKLMIIITLSTFITLVVIGVLFVQIEHTKSKEDLVKRLTTIARVLSAHSPASLVFKDKNSALENLQTLKFKQNIIAAAIFDSEDEIFVKYESGIERRYDFSSFKKNSETGFVNDKLFVYEPIMLDDKAIGTLFIVVSLKEINQIWLNLLYLAFIMIFIGSFFSFILASWLQKFISQPILLLKNTAEKVTLTKDYTLRVNQRSNDETGSLVDAFNSMLAFIEKQNKELNKTNMQLQMSQAELEERVKSRTAELQESNQKLQTVAEELNEQKIYAEKSNVAKSQFLANMSHEIRTPINAIMGMLHLLGRTTLDTQQVDYVSKAQGAANSLLNIVNDILDFSKIESGKLNIEQVPFNLDKVLNNLKNIIEVQTKTKNLDFFVSVDKELPKLLKGDPYRLEQVLINLCNNAVKFTNHGSVTLNIKCLEKNSEEIDLKFSVQDSGIGMSKEQQEKIFEEFSQADTSTTRKFGGTGLGLSISSKLVTMMGGRLWLESSTKGIGSTFSFEIPLHHVEDSFTAKVTEEIDRNGILKNLSVLIVDDNEASRNVLLKDCALLGLKGDAVSSGEEALSAIENGEYDIVFLDWKMPELNGVETAKKIYALKNLAKEPKIIIVTAYNREDIFNQIKDTKIENILVKPIVLSDMLNTIMNSVDLKGITHNAIAHIKTSLKSIQDKKILVVEDNELNLMFITDLLAHEGILIDSARDGYEAVDKVKASKYDLVLMDVQMPELDGIEATKLIRKLEFVLNEEYYAVLPIIGLSANVLQDDINHALEAGMNTYLFKPIEPEELFQTLLDFLAEESSSSNGNDIDESSIIDEVKLQYDYSSLHGIDQDAALKQVLHNEDLLIRLFDKFAQYQGDSFKTVMELISQNKLEDAGKLTHQLKGIVGNIGARELYTLLNEIDLGLKKQEPTETLLLKKTEDEYDKLVSSINEFISSLQHSDSKQDTNILSDDDAVALLEEIVKYIDEEFNRSFELFKKLKGYKGGIISKSYRNTIESLFEIKEVDMIKEMISQVLKK